MFWLFAQSLSPLSAKVVLLGVSQQRRSFPSSEAAWQEELPDKRLVRRLQRLLDQLSAAAGKPIPACGDCVAAKAGYRFFDNPRVTQRSRRPFRCDCGVVAKEGPLLIL
ncbi:IS4/Tn5 family transposase DNA-binding protein [Mesorhizobium humile]|uniref:IS4/Tn5 family transposase DNA-binding protein n=1 Tax=Mesorhizobium humile TaxID=3072313 RepID=UPI003D31DD75